MVKVNSAYAVKMNRVASGKIEALVVSSTLHKNNLNVQALVKAGFEVSEVSLGRTKGGQNFGGNAQYFLYVVGTDEQAKELDGVAYKALVDAEKPAPAPVKKEEPVKQAEVPVEPVAEVVADAVPEAPKRTTKKTTKKVDSTETN